MTQPEAVVVYIKIGGIQDYIFSSNRLRENIGASYLVKRATSCPDNGLEGWIDPSETEAEVIFAGGGNACILFYSMKQAKLWVRQYSLRVLREAAGLRFAIGMSAQFAYDPDQHDIKIYINQAHSDVNQAQNSYTTIPATLGLGVTAACRSTGLVATLQRNQVVGVPRDPGDYPISREIVAKTKVASKTSAQIDLAMNDLLQQINAFEEINQKYSIPRDFDDFGRTTGKYSYLAVVHADGNGIGNLIRILAYISTSNKHYIQFYRQVSELINTLGAAAMNATVDFLGQNIVNPAFKELTHHLERDPDTGNPFFPLRPLVYGGDDITFVCDARVAFHVTPVLLEQFTRQSKALITELKQNFPEETTSFPNELSACAGITIFRTHYPFARAYDLAEELCKSAKDLSSSLTGKKQSALDWQIAPSGRIHTLAELRQVEYALNASETLTIRPVMLDGDRSWRLWTNVKRAIQNFNRPWLERRNKLIAFQDVNRQGKQATEHWQANLREPLTLTQFAGLQHQDAWATDDVIEAGTLPKQLALYFDVIELMEHYPPLAEVQGV
ncbi:Cas10/Cmr2 second palm domain-containing protein [Herpetosiphon llansteffanensis]|uniref:Cas10/Cmr2 second palm domain-containing protein n=1 Tax=Herpetosiphon llansteffanensis TaxID=2094568 RepID=UPI000D7C2265|nr:hypothetical protein [Herpetosiphon llansteffanensis]